MRQSSIVKAVSRIDDEFDTSESKSESQVVDQERLTKKKERYEYYVGHLERKIERIEKIVDKQKGEVSELLKRERVQMYEGLTQRDRKNLMSLDNTLIDQNLELETIRRQNRKLTDFGGLPK